MRWKCVWLCFLAFSFANVYDVQAILARNHVSSICSTWGREHFKTFDGDVYQFPGMCEYNLASDCHETYREFSVHLKREENDGNPTVSYVVVTINDLLFHLTSSRVTLNDLPIKMPYYNAGVQVEKNAVYIKLQSKVGITVMWNGDDAVMVEVDNDYANRTCGLCGDFNGISVYDEFIHNGRIINPVEFGNKHKVHRPNDDCEDPYEEEDNSLESVNVLDSCKEFQAICEEMLHSESWKSCSELVNPEPYIKACVKDMCGCTNNEDDLCVCSTLSEFSRQCSHAGGQPPNWRKPQFCAKQCPFNMVYEESGSPCMDTCTYQDTSSLCEDHKMDGCFCPPGTVFDDISMRGCIAQSECQCKSDKIYNSGEVFRQDPVECTCLEGRWDCKSLHMPATCAVEEGSHVTTFDGKTYTFHGDCYYTLAKVESKNDASPKFTMLVQLVPCANQEFDTCLKTLKILINNDRNNVLLFTSDGTVKHNMQTISLPYHSGDIHIFEASSFHILLQTSFGLQIQIQHVPVMQVYVSLDNSYKGKTRGLCGNYNMVLSDDMKTPQGIVEGTAATFCNSWKANVICADREERLDDPCSLSMENELYARHWCALLLSPNSTFSQCRSVVDPEIYYKRCTYASCNCEKSEACLCAVLSSYARACASKGVFLTDWRENVCDKYTKSCPKSQTFSYKHQRCQLTCSSLSLQQQSCSSDFLPVDGCSCSEGLYLDENGICVPMAKCPCYHNEVYIKPGKSINIKNEHCVCTNGMLHCHSWQARSSICPSPKTFFNCSDAGTGELGVHCPQTCMNLDSDDCDSTECESGCQCPRGLFDNGKGSCVKKINCPCHHNGNLYAPGAIIPNKCNTCTCKSGKWECTEKKCPGTCIIYGSGHYNTFDQRTYAFQGHCAYVAVKNKCGNKTVLENFGVITENVPCGSTGTTCSKTVRIQLGRTEIKLSKGKHEKEDLGYGTQIPYKIRTVGLYLVVESAIGLAVMWDRKTTVRILLEPQHSGEVCGLCGNFDGDGQNDFTTQGQLAVSDFLEFANSWKVSSTCPDAEMNVDPCVATPNRHHWAKIMCSIIIGETFKQCHNKVDPLPFHDNCVKDSCACDTGGDCECFCTAVAAYAQACNEAGVCVAWRTPDICPAFCDYYNNPGECKWHYYPCHTPCYKTCLNPQGDCRNPLPNLEGCYPQCPKEKPIFDEEKQICVEECEGCFYNGSRYDDYEVIYNVTDNLGMCYYAICINSTVIYQNVSCPTTTVQPPTSTIATTPPVTTPTVPPTTPPTETPTTITIATTPATEPPTTTAESTTKTTATPTTPCHKTCKWSEYYDVHNPKFDKSDWETYENITNSGKEICKTRKEIDCRSVDFPDKDFSDFVGETGQVVSCDLEYGLICRREDQVRPPRKCFNYKISVCCEVDECPPTYTTTATTTKLPTTTTEATTLPPETTTTIATTTPTESPTTTAEPTTTTEATPTPTESPTTTAKPTTTTIYVSPPTSTTTAEPTTTTEATTLPPETTTTTTIATTTPTESPTTTAEPTTTTEATTLPPETTTTTTIATTTPTESPTTTAGPTTTTIPPTETPTTTAEPTTTTEATTLPPETTTTTTTATTPPTESPTTTAGPTTTTIPPTETPTTTAEPTTTTIYVSPSTSTTTKEPTTTTEGTTPPTETPTTITIATTPATEPPTTTAGSTTKTTATPTTPCHKTCKWSEYYDVHNPKFDKSDWETYENITNSGKELCKTRTEIDCRSVDFPDKDFSDFVGETGQVVSCDLEYGLICRREDQVRPPRKCFNYKISVCCEVDECPPTYTTTATTTKLPTTTTEATTLPPETTTTIATTTPTESPTTTAEPTTTTEATPTPTESPTTTAKPTTTTIYVSPPTSTTTAEPTTTTEATTLPPETTTTTIIATTTPTESPTTTAEPTTTTEATTLPPETTTTTTIATTTTTESPTTTAEPTTTTEATTLPPETTTTTIIATTTPTESPTTTAEPTTTTEATTLPPETTTTTTIATTTPTESPTTTAGPTTTTIPPTETPTTTAEPTTTTEATTLPPETTTTTTIATTTPTESPTTTVEPTTTTEPTTLPPETTTTTTIVTTTPTESRTTTAEPTTTTEATTLPPETTTTTTIATTTPTESPTTTAGPTTTTIPPTETPTTTAEPTTTTEATTLPPETTTTTTTATTPPTESPTTTAGPTTTTIPPTETPTTTAEPTTTTIYVSPSTSTTTKEPTTTTEGTTPPTETPTTITIATTPATEPPTTTAGSTTKTTATPTTPCHKTCKWSEYYDVHNPKFDKSDWETYENITNSGKEICKTRTEIDCRSVDFPDKDFSDFVGETGQVVSCDLEYGLICRREDQVRPPRKCFNYKISVCCEVDECPPTYTTTATTTKLPTTTTEATTLPPETTTTIATTTPTESPTTTAEPTTTTEATPTPTEFPTTTAKPTTTTIYVSPPTSTTTAEPTTTTEATTLPPETTTTIATTTPTESPTTTAGPTTTTIPPTETPTTTAEPTTTTEATTLPPETTTTTTIATTTPTESPTTTAGPTTTTIPPTETPTTTAEPTTTTEATTLPPETTTTTTIATTTPTESPTTTAGPTTTTIPPTETPTTTAEPTTTIEATTLPPETTTTTTIATTTPTESPTTTVEPTTTTEATTLPPETTTTTTIVTTTPTESPTTTAEPTTTTEATTLPPETTTTIATTTPTESPTTTAGPTTTTIPPTETPTTTAEPTTTTEATTLPPETTTTTTIATTTPTESPTTTAGPTTTTIPPTETPTTTAEPTTTTEATTLPPETTTTTTIATTTPTESPTTTAGPTTTTIPPTETPTTTAEPTTTTEATTLPPETTTTTTIATTTPTESPTTTVEPTTTTKATTLPPETTTTTTIVTTTPTESPTTTAEPTTTTEATTLPPETTTTTTIATTTPTESPTTTAEPTTTTEATTLPPETTTTTTIATTTPTESPTTTAEPTTTTEATTLPPETTTTTTIATTTPTESPTTTAEPTTTTEATTLPPETITTTTIATTTPTESPTTTAEPTTTTEATTLPPETTTTTTIATTTPTESPTTTAGPITTTIPPTETPTTTAEPTTTTEVTTLPPETTTTTTTATTPPTESPTTTAGPTTTTIPPTETPTTTAEPTTTTEATTPPTESPTTTAGPTTTTIPPTETPTTTAEPTTTTEATTLPPETTTTTTTATTPPTESPTTTAGPTTTTIPPTETPTTTAEPTKPIVTGPTVSTVHPSTAPIVSPTPTLTTTTESTTTECFCIVNGKHYKPGDKIFDKVHLGSGVCLTMICSNICEIHNTTEICPTPAPTPFVPTCPEWDKVQNETFIFCNCTMARCIENNTIEIIPYECPPIENITCTNGKKPVLVYDENHCCQHYVCDCVCEGWGDPHYITFDGFYYSYQGNCTYVLMEEMVPKYDLKIYIDNVFCDPTEDVSCPRSIIISYQSHVVTLMNHNLLGAPQLEALENGVSLKLPYSNRGIKILNSGINLVFEIPHLQAIITFGITGFSVTLPFRLFGRNTQGHCGTCNNDQADDCMLPGGHLVKSCPVMADYWLARHILQPECHIPTVLPTNKPEPPPTLTPCRPDSVCDLLKSSVFSECYPFVSPDNFYRGCVFDSCHVSNPAVECTSLQTYAAACAQAGVCLHWRKHTNICASYCPANTVYSPCGPAEQPTCEDNPNESTLNFTTEGCFCPEGMKLFNKDSGICVNKCGCLDPEGIPREFNERFDYKCQNCICEESTKTVSCKPKACPAPPVANCSGPGFVLVNQTNPSDQCCSAYVCQCQSKTCPVTDMNCPVGYKPDVSVPEGKCCPEHTCEPKRVCVHKETEYQPGSSVPANTCQDCTCTNEVDTHSGLFKIVCEFQQCQENCDPGYKYVESDSDKCCGKCVQTHCIVALNGTNQLLEAREVWSPPANMCEHYTCLRNGEKFITINSHIVCPPFQPSNCKSDTIQTAANGCCQTCVEKEKACKLLTQRARLTHKGCQSYEEIDMPYCEGSCTTYTKYSEEAASFEHFCSCCKETRFSKRIVDLHCLNGDVVPYTYMHVEECSCNKTECIRAPGQSVRRRRSIMPV
ncbi:mucin-2-like [Channa argus]|uniref:mucin-2-like n=1 Tax=Channa argus TaxID=215402 RepID=UPI0035213163